VSTADDPSGQDDGQVLIERAGAVATLTLARPSALNAMTWTMYEQLETHVRTLASDQDVRAIILRGQGTRAFAAGTDIRQFATFSGADGVAYERRIDRIMDLLTSLPQPLIAAVQGYAVGGGLALVAACDLRYASADARFGIPVARTLGNCLSLRNYQRLGQAFGLMRAKEMLFTGHLLSADEALRAGFLTAIVDEEDVFARAREVAEQISQNAPLTLWATKEAFHRLGAATNAALAQVAFDDVITRVYDSADFHEGVRAHGEKRKPEWEGR
jgi:enoyl-CoA hydratase/carnithine racemase